MTSLVIAHKFNDIFYALNTSEFKKSDKHILIIIEKGLIKADNFPFKEYFEEISILTFSTNINYLKLIYSLNLQFDINRNITYAFISNPIMILNQRLIKVLKVKDVILLEDGVMNYRAFIPSKSILKRISQLLLNVSNQKLYNKILRTYLIKPSKAIYAFGKLEQIKIDRSNVIIDKSILDKINGKKIFVGNDFYVRGFISQMKYLDIVNKIIGNFDIDYYLPHAFSDNEETVNCKILDLSSLAVTLEIIAGFADSFEIYSFGSSVNFSCKQINTNIKTYTFNCDTFSVSVSDFIMKNSDNSYIVDKNNNIILH